MDASSHNVYVANYADNTVSVIDGPGFARSVTVTANIAVGREPDAVALDPTHHTVYVTNYADDTLG